MKKKLIAIAVAIGASSGTAQAAEVYSMNGVTLNLYGEVEIQYIKIQDPDYQSEWNLDEANFGFDLQYEMTEDLTMGATLGIDANNTDFDGSSTDNDDVTRTDTYGKIVYKKSNTFTFGTQSTILDDAGIGRDYAFGFTSYYDRMNTSGDQVLKYKYDGGEIFYGGISYMQYRNTTASDHDTGDYQTDGSIGARIEDINLSAFVAESKTQGLDGLTYVLQSEYTYGDWNFAATYGNTKTEQGSGNADTNSRIYGATASYFDGGRLEYAAGYSNVDTTGSTTATNNKETNDFYVNVTYTLIDEVAVYAELGVSDDKDETTGYVIGLDAAF
ncbi:porin [Vibrio viridaestus]|uniref:Porin n=1 Tax=Vibrio viridaestus TaxID=2487322 RepID=A0A3N9TI64_9VIBR|nr:porin [Vibrio viridaestus]RQW63889.1 porin [Vibrio viridaestus]